jgi:hypothetical protein
MIGMVLSVSGASAALLALRLLRVATCPVCGAIGTLTTLRLVTDDRAGLGNVVTRHRRCGQCGAVLEDQKPERRSFGWPRIATLAHHLMR